MRYSTLLDRVLPFILIVSVLFPYRDLVIGRTIPIPDDIFVSDLADGEFPAYVEAGRIRSHGHAARWTSGISLGLPLVVHPLGEFWFSWWSPAVALGSYLGILLSTAAIGTYLFTRRLGGTPVGAMLSGFAFAWSGFVVCQMRHLGVLGTVALFPLALYLLDRVAMGTVRKTEEALRVAVVDRVVAACGFSIVFGLQLLAGFPQSAYICAVFYAAFCAAMLVRLSTDEGGFSLATMRSRASTLGGIAALFVVSAAVGGVSGARTLVPLFELGRLSDRGAENSFEWAVRFRYDPANLLSFLDPYVYGDISNATYELEGIFWEVYGYVGVVTVLLAFVVVAIRPRQFGVASVAIGTAFAIAMLLGPTLPLYRWAFEYLPGFASFRMPTRFLFVVDLGIAVLGGLGLSVLERWVAARLEHRSPRLVAIGICLALTTYVAVDLVSENARQNPFVSAPRWLAPPASAAHIRSHGGGRVFTPAVTTLHQSVFAAARGWSGDLSPYWLHREALQPNSNLLHGVASLEGYSGISPRWFVDLVGDHNRSGVVRSTFAVGERRLDVSRSFVPWLETLSVRWVLTTGPLEAPGIVEERQVGPLRLHRLPSVLPRARLVHRIRREDDIGRVAREVENGTLDIRTTLVLPRGRVEDPFDEAIGESFPDDSVRLVNDESSRVVVRTSGRTDSYLVLADTYYPGWTVSVDGRAAAIERADFAIRSVRLAAGSHLVEFRYDPMNAIRASWISSSALIALALLATGLAARKRMTEVSRTA